MNAFQFIFQYIKRHKVQYTLGIITLFVVDFANIFIPKLTGVITDGLTAHSLDWSGVKLNLLYLFLLGLLLADTYIKIPMCGQVESLNAAISASLLMYETNRQRRIRSMSQDRMSNIRKVEE